MHRGQRERCCHPQVLRIDQHAEPPAFGNEVAQQFQTLLRQHQGEDRNAGDIAARPAEAGDQSGLDGIAADDEDDRYRRGRPLGRERRGVGARK
jgi:hypothetical protein